ncbi:cadmium resistance transporter [Lentilactobacillus buchneri]|uniref:Cadmium resistance transporter n=1 Tax=Lentilactobacillus buchneri subsp. silagei CD034 TaxID=1071400 RepID=J9W3T7_LENBU|nr:cadmium resistance transporter [Lentilactobacillus buchneri]MCC6101608.1 cadmium resistance transporter [Lactobacillus sp.]AFS00989.1 cadmium resistance transporter [Lentilactobacillus buchneri subsp. silagei CD034]MCT2899877.1 calcium-binding protein [Lentilactobacillus buchneri]MCT3542910.1 calcium-binding protein [Lentilactobacillus buchneri]MCT3544391.1 calcium-binding protein [Lentilactobacillus buchneri]
MLTTIMTSILSFIGTNIDDTFVLAVWFSQVDASLRRRDIVIGQFIGFEILVLVSVLAAYGLSFLPTEQVGWLGVVPIVLGIRKWLQYRHQLIETHETAHVKTKLNQELKVERHKSGLRKLFKPEILAVSLITISNGAGNLTVYIPLFTEYTVAELGITVLVFSLMTGLWCYIGYQIANLPIIKDKLERSKQILIPIIFVAIGVYVLIESGVLG